MKILNYINTRREAKKPIIAQLIDPDYIQSIDQLLDIAAHAEKCRVDLFLFGGSLITKTHDFNIVKALKSCSKIPVLLFPASVSHIDQNADGILFLSLISGRNPEYLIGNHVLAAPILKNSGLEVIPTSYLLVGNNSATTAHYISNTQSIPKDKAEIAAATAYAGQLLGHSLIYLDAGSGATETVSADMVSQVREWVNLPIIVGGGIRTPEKALELIAAGADVLVIGNGAQENPEFLTELYQKMI